MKLSTLDVAVVVIYLSVMVGMGAAVKRRAAQGLESYFLGGRRLPWWALAMSGSSSYFDITGTMWIVSLFVILGLRGMWVQWIWGFVISVFYAAYMGRWIRLSSVMTGSEWMLFRFGTGRGGDAARLAYTIYAILTVTAFLAFAALGMAKFVSAFVDTDPRLVATVVIALAGFYVIVGGFQGMILVEVMQTLVLSAGALLICWLGYANFNAVRFSVPAEWWSLAPVTATASVDDPNYRFFGLLVLVYVTKGLSLCLSGPEQLFDFQRFLAARDARDAQKLGALWGVIHTIRWPMAMAIAVLALLGSNAGFRETLSRDPERALPLVLANYLPRGVTGLAIAALLSGFLTTFSSNVNAGASYLVKDVYKRYINPRADDRHLVRVSYAASTLLVALGLLISFFARSINLMFLWIMGTLGAGVLVPNVLRWYWWRINGWGYACGAFAGMALSLMQVLAETLWARVVPLYVSFPVIVILVGAVTVVTSLATTRDEPEQSVDFYRRTGVWGFWGPVARVADRAGDVRNSSPGRDLGTVLLGLPFLIALYLAPMYVILHRWQSALACAVIVCIFAVLLYFQWYREALPPADKRAAASR
jgi:solute:Na+ symporter, SSS family